MPGAVPPPPGESCRRRTHAVQPEEPSLPDDPRLLAEGSPLPPRPGARPQARQVRRGRDAAPPREERRPDLREGLDPHPVRLRGRLLRPGGERHLPRSLRLPDRQEGDDEGHGPGSRADVRRHRVPRLRAGDRRGAGEVGRRPGLQRADRRVPPDPDPRGPPDDARAQRQAARADLLRLPRRRAQQHGEHPHARRRPHGDGRSPRRAEAPLAGRRARREGERAGRRLRRRR